MFVTPLKITVDYNRFLTGQGIAMSSKFKKVIEDFVCEHCNTKVSGNGFTNHCPKCLWGKHVDINPGDRKALCNGMMEPIRIEKKGQGISVIHKCVKCDFERANKISRDDDFDVVLKIAENFAKKTASSL